MNGCALLHKKNIMRVRRTVALRRADPKVDPGEACNLLGVPRNVIMARVLGLISNRQLYVRIRTKMLNKVRIASRYASRTNPGLIGP